MKQSFTRLKEFMFFCGEDSSNLTPRKRYRCLRRSLLIIMMFITIVPLSLTTGISYFQYHDLLREETYNNARWNAENARLTIETFLDKLQAAIIITADTHTFQELIDQEKLDRIFAKLKLAYPGLVDLSVIGPDGIQHTYAGPYTLVGKNYNESLWYNKTLAKKFYISEVFLGYRQSQHFVVAVSKKLATRPGYWVLRASIDAETLDDFLASINTETDNDIFLLNHTAKLQSSSRYYGKVNDDFPLNHPPPKNGIALSEEYRDNKPILRATGYLRGTPWILVLDQKGYAERKAWRSFKNNLLGFFFLCALIAGANVVWISNFLARRIRDADESREAIITQTEHTEKLASIGRLAAGVAHEINNPLSIINEKAGLMKDLLEVGDDWKYRDKFLNQLTALQDAVQRSKIITHRLLGFARRMDISLEDVQINDVLTEVIGFLDKEAIYRVIELKLVFQEDLPAIKSDRGQLQQIFLNIINNAIDAVDDHGKIIIESLTVDPASVQVNIIDNGPGMPPEVMKNIFEPFFTTKKANTKHGTGLGLAISYGLVKKLGGKISVSSTVGKGSTFEITFPLNTTGKENGSNDQDENTDY